MSESVLLSCIRHNVTIQDGQIIFEAASGCWSTHTRFAFEKPREINNTPGIWYFVELDSSSGTVPASHIVQAYEWCVKHFGPSFEDAPAEKGEAE